MGVTEAEFSPWASFCNHDFKEDFLKEEESGAKYKSEWGKKKRWVRDFLGGPVVKNPPANQGTCVRSPVWEDSISLRADKPTNYNNWSQHF